MNKTRKAPVERNIQPMVVDQEPVISGHSEHSYAKVSNEGKNGVKPGPSRIQAPIVLAPIQGMPDLCSFEEDLTASLQKRIDSLEAEKAHLQKQLKGVLNLFDQEQINLLNGEKKKIRWSPKALQKAIHTRYVCGSAGYEHLRSQGYPLPSSRHLAHSLSSLKYEPGMLEENWKLLKLKVDKMPANQRHVSLVLDEMSLQSKIEFDPSSQTISGMATIPPSEARKPKKTSGEKDDYEDVAVQTLVFMLAGLKTRFKMVVAYHHTTKSYAAEPVKNLILDIIERAKSIGLRVWSTGGDQGSCNRAV